MLLRLLAVEEAHLKQIYSLVDLVDIQQVVFHGVSVDHQTGLNQDQDHKLRVVVLGGGGSVESGTAGLALIGGFGGCGPRGGGGGGGYWGGGGAGGGRGGAGGSSYIGGLSSATYSLVKIGNAVQKVIIRY